MKSTLLRFEHGNSKVWIIKLTKQAICAKACLNWPSCVAQLAYLRLNFFFTCMFCIHMFNNIYYNFRYPETLKEFLKQLLSMSDFFHSKVDERDMVTTFSIILFYYSFSLSL